MDFQIGAAGIFILFVLMLIGGFLIYNTKEAFTGYYTDLQKKESERYTLLQFGHL